jgi:S1-C subfamily serine protease
MKHRHSALSSKRRLLVFLVVVVATTLLFLANIASAFSIPTSTKRQLNPLFSSFKTSIQEIEKDLTDAEKSVTSVVRKCGPAVAFVTSIVPTTTTTQRQRRRWGRNNNNNNNNNNNSRNNRNRTNKNNLPPGQSLGSGSGFVVDSDGYICTNYHVIEQAYRVTQVAKSINTTVANVTQSCSIIASVLNETLSIDQEALPRAFVRIESATQFQECRIVDVYPELDLAVLKVLSPQNNSSSYPFIEFGSSSRLIVGQSVVAIGNPFGLDNTVTSGVVSSTNREYPQAVAGNTIKNCIQTDAAINPGNSGGPLLNLKGEVVGINTAIITTSGSNAGIGFSVPSDQIYPQVQRIIRNDRSKQGARPNQGYLGISILMNTNSTSSCTWVSSVAENSPAAQAGIGPLKVTDSGVVEWGDSIVAIGGNTVSTLEEIESELSTRVVGENVALTLERKDGEKRVVYVVLSERPSTT